MRIVPAVTLSRPRFRLLPFVAAMLICSLVLMLPAWFSSNASRACVQSVYLPELQAQVQMLRTSPHQGPTLVRACLYGRDLTRCTDDRWIRYDRIDAVAAALGRARQPGERDVLGCVYVERGDACACERHSFSLTLAESR